MSSYNEYLEISGPQIKEIRKKEGLSQQEFGARLGVTHAHISKIESGKERPSETLLRLIKYEFNTNERGESPKAEFTRPRIKQYLDMLNDIFNDESISDLSLFCNEFLLSAYVSMLVETKNSSAYQELLLDAIAGIFDEVAQFLTGNDNDINESDSKIILSTKLQRAKYEISGCIDLLYDLLDERIGGEV